MDYKGSDLTIAELLSALQIKIDDLSKIKRSPMQPCLQRSEVLLPISINIFTIYKADPSQIEQHKEKMGDTLQSCKRLLNTFAAINQLPVEILTQVFRNLQSHRSCENKFPPRLAITQTRHVSDAKDALSWVRLTTNICKHWREVALFTPSLWNHIYFDIEATQSNSWSYLPSPSVLLRSHPVPLHMTIFVDPRNACNSDPKDFFNALQTVTNRVETLQISWECQYKRGFGMLHALRHPFPRLTSLALQFRDNSLANMRPDPLPAAIFGGELPQLRRLSLWFYTCWSQHKFPKLTHISLHEQLVRPSVNEFLDILESAPCLEFLFLWEAGPRIVQGDILPRRTISLPALRFAQFASKASDDRYNARILECLNIPQSTRCLLLYTHQDPRISYDSVERLFTHIRPERINELRVYQYKQYTYTFALEMDASRISIQNMPISWLDSGIPKFRNIHHLHLVPKNTPIPKVNLGGFPSLVTITCYDSLNGIHRFVTSLSEDETETGCPCPFLETIYFYVGEQISKLRSLYSPHDEEFVRRALDCMPEPITVIRARGHSFQVVLKLQSAFPRSDESETEALITFPADYMQLWN
ncbi:hypothetical protein M413DRAFT_23229 [Hebeloma cylindrosporum]|uniref:F-box domain-containing protein n=1 Tax=Hebeloma cylindrosporum TaxID=76867 RepID=A0A0C3CDP2_HEBCY|nr:hypothetical protein M413DRAFT_23229 [Hebeloma cylindrosporum h7]